jgi:hypothetical protein
MSDQSLLDRNRQAFNSHAPTEADLPPSARGESPLASQLPPWDLVPAHTLLVRRRPVAANRPPNPSQTPIAPAPPIQGEQQAAAISPELPKTGSFCEDCGANLKEASTFCGYCGAKQ